jgi:hypothetical protein
MRRLCPTLSHKKHMTNRMGQSKELNLLMSLKVKPKKN